MNAHITELVLVHSTTKQGILLKSPLSLSLSVATHAIMEVERSHSPRRHQLSSSSTNGSSDCSMKSMSIDNGGGGGGGVGTATTSEETQPKEVNQNACIALVCSSMRRQIISRAFYGWLAYCRHLSTVRTHLSGLVNGRITPDCEDLAEPLPLLCFN